MRYRIVLAGLLALGVAGCVTETRTVVAAEHERVAEAVGVHGDRRINRGDPGEGFDVPMDQIHPKRGFVLPFSSKDLDPIGIANLILRGRLGVDHPRKEILASHAPSPSKLIPFLLRPGSSIEFSLEKIVAEDFDNRI